MDYLVTCCNTFINLLPLSLLLGLFLLRFFDEVMGKYRIAKEKLDKFGDKTPAGGRQPLPGLSSVFKPGPGGGESQLRR